MVFHIRLFLGKANGKNFQKTQKHRSWSDLGPFCPFLGDLAFSLNIELRHFFYSYDPNFMKKVEKAIELIIRKLYHGLAEGQGWIHKNSH